MTDEFWDKINQVNDEYDQSGSFVTFPGYEWSGNTPLGGDRNIYHRTAGGAIYRSSHDLLPDEYSKYPTAPTAENLFARLNPAESFAFAHVGGRYADVTMHRDSIEVAMEVHSAWGTFQWLVDDALKLGHRIGICANSDGHKCRPGASYPGANKFGSYGGLTCVLADKLDREVIFAAMKARHFYATTGHRLLLDVELVTADGHRAIMGDVIEVDGQKSELKVKISGTAPIDYVEIHNGLEIIETVRNYSEADLGNAVKLVWSGAEVKGRDRKTIWDGKLKINGNTIKSFTPVNFWNPDAQPQQLSSNEISWKSITTGGVAGLIVELETRHSGSLNITTEQLDCELKIASIGLDPRSYEVGGVAKQLEVYKLPQQANSATEFNFTLTLDKRLRNGDNPLYVKVVQQDGHIAWSSPVYLVYKLNS